MEKDNVDVEVEEEIEEGKEEALTESKFGAAEGLDAANRDIKGSDTKKVSRKSDTMTRRKCILRAPPSSLS
jgi:hypothetical protein